MKVKHALVALILGYCLDFVGALRMITHAGDAQYILYAGLLLKVFGALLLLYKLLTYSKFKDFMNW